MEANNKTVTLHRLCDTCRTLCRDSKLLNDDLAWERSTDRYGDWENGTCVQANLIPSLYFGKRDLAFYSPQDEVRIRQFLKQYPTEFTRLLVPGVQELRGSGEHESEHNSIEPHSNEPESNQPHSKNSETRPKEDWAGMDMFIEKTFTRQITKGDLEVSASQGCHLCNLLILRRLDSHEKTDPKAKLVVALGIWFPIGQVLLMSMSEFGGLSVIRIREINGSSIFVDDCKFSLLTQNLIVWVLNKYLF